MKQLITVAVLSRESVLLVEDGNHGEYRPRPHEFSDSGIPYIRAADISPMGIDFEGAGRITHQARQRIRKGVGLPLDTLLSHKGTVGKVALAPEDAPEFVCSPQTTFWRSLDTRRLNPRYLRYVLESPSFQLQLAFLQGQSDMAPYVSLTDQRNLTLTLLPAPQQDAIAEVLGALDDKIAANARLSATSNALAAALFDTHSATTAAKKVPYGNLASIGGGGTPRTASPEFWDGIIPWATPTDVTGLLGPYLGSTRRMITELGLQTCASPLYPVGTILMTSRATIGAFALTQVPMAVNQGFITVNARDPLLQFWLFHDMQRRVDEFLSYANGATFLELSRGRFRALDVELPDDTVIRSFDSEAQALHSRAQAALSENQRLTTLRDTILPQLMSGRLRVKDAERQVEDAL